MLKKIAFFSIACVMFVLASAQSQEMQTISNRTNLNFITKEISLADSINRLYPDSAEQLLYHALSASLKTGYSEGVRGAYYGLMMLNYNQMHFDETIDYANLLISHCDILNHKSLICDALLCKGMSYYAMENYYEALENYQQSLWFASADDRIASIYNNMATVLSNLNQFKKALTYINKALEVSDANPNSIRLSNKAGIYEQLGDFKNALLYFDSAFHVAIDLEDKANIVFRKIILLSEHKEETEALTQFLSFKPFLGDDLSSQRKCQVFLAGGIAYYKMKDYKNAEKYLLKARQLSQFLSTHDQRVLTHKLSELYYATKNYKKAFDLHKLSHNLEDSAKSKEILIKVNELETKFRTAEKDKAIAEQKAIISKNKEQRLKDRVLGAGIFVALVFLLLLLWVRYYYLKQKNQKLQSEQEINRLQAMMEGEEKERTRLSHELHDGVNSSLAATASYLQTVAQLHPEMAQTTPFIKVKQLLESTSSEVRAVAHNLAPHILMKNGLKYAIEDFCANLFPKDVAVEVQSFGDDGNLSDSAALFTYRIAQELLHNVHKHACATEVIVILGILEDEINLTVEDNGASMATTESKKTGIGLESLKDKIRNYKGRVTIDSDSSKGTAIHVVIPINGGPETK